MFNVLITAEAIGAKLNEIVWSPVLVYLLLATGVYFTIRTSAVQIRRVRTMVKLLFSGGDSDRGVSSFQAFALSVAGRVGTGNIAGVATAIAYGGPGALFWMWAIATLGSASSYVECTLGQIYKEEVDGEFRGGPAYYFEKFSGHRIFGIMFAIITVTAMAVFLPGVQSNSITSSVQGAFFANSSNPEQVKLITGVIIAVLLAVIIFGGTKRLARSAEIIVPFMSISYILIALIILIMNIGQVPETFATIFREAFKPASGLGGVVGTAVMYGVKRGLYSNEAAQGTGPHAASAAAVNHPAEQGLVQAFSVYFDTLFVCSATGFMIIITDSYNSFSASGAVVHDGTNVADKALPGPGYTQDAVSTLLGDNIGPKFVAIALFFFAFTTLMAYIYMAECNIVYLTARKDKDGKEVSSKPATLLVRALFLFFTVFFSFQEVASVWNFADVGVGVMAWYNVIGILIIAGPALKVLKDYERILKEGSEIKFDPEALKIKNTEVW